MPKKTRDSCLRQLPIFKQLLQMPYWRRVWIIQELAVASVIKICCGKFTLPWEALECNCENCHGLREENTTMTKRTRSTYDSMFSLIMLEVIRYRSRERDAIDLISLLYQTRVSLATNTRDKIYALLGLAYDGGHFVPEPSYMASVSECFTELTSTVIQEGPTLDYICLRSANRPHIDEVLSWVPDWADLDDKIADRIFNHIRRMNTYLDGKHVAYRLEGSQHAHTKIGGGVLLTRGVHLDTVVSTSHIQSEEVLVVTAKGYREMTASRQVCIGDALVCLYGCTLLVILREDETDGRNGKFRVVCFVEDTPKG
jgi:hypothetical protein